MNMRFWKHARCLRPVSGPTSGTTTRAAVSSSTTPTNTMPPNGAGSTRGPASRRSRRDLTRFVLSSFDAADSLQPPSSSSWQVWQDALDLTQSGESGEVHCYFHYTTQVGFRNITAPSKKAVEVFVLHSVTIQHVNVVIYMICDFCGLLTLRQPQTS